MLALAATVHEGFPGPHGDLPEVDGDAGVFQRFLNIVVITDGSAAGGDKDVGLRCFANGALSGLQIVRHDAKVHDRGAKVLGHGSQCMAVGRDDLVRTRFAAWQDQFIPSGDQGHDRAAAHGELGCIGGSGKTDVACAERETRRQECVALAEVETGKTDVLIGFYRLQDSDGLSVGFGVLLDDNGVGPLWYRRTREDTHAVATFQPALEAVTGCGQADQAERGGRVGDICCDDRITVHGGGVERRLVADGFERLCQDAAKRLFQRHPCGRQWLHIFQDASAGLFDRDQGHGVTPR